MNRVLRLLSVLVPLALCGLGAAAQGSVKWKFMSEDEFSRSYLLADSIVDEGNGVKVVWVRAVLKQAENFGHGPIDRFDMHYRLDCRGHRTQLLETHDSMGERLVHTTPPRGDPLEQVPDNPAWRPVFIRVCGTGGSA